MRQRPKGNLSDREWERLSAYIDGEATAQEREQIEQQLQNNPAYQHAYSQLLHLQDSFAGLSVRPARDRPSATADDMADAVLQRLEQSPLIGTMSPTWARRCARIAAGLVLLVSAGSLLWRIEQPSPSELMISLDEPPLDIPTLDIPTEAIAPELTSTYKAESYLLSPGTADDAYSILLTDI